ncbi:terminase large subunit domain-containing protein [Novosphingobium olei]|uniref:Terminase n=1 Tax=Novosphingobium olei TaxID=2728851 RepID=A0A7Y0BM14_9SPHN|nr:terminase family protein [Novosphingobium olei]NML92869.1 hypothetical protein [Novosphingobium olei]
MAAPDLNLATEHLRAFSRRSFPFFCRGAMKALLPTTTILWHPYLDLIASRLQDVIDGKRRRLIINVPPRYGKSLVCSVALPAFLLGRNPHAQIINATYANDLSKKMSRDTRRLMETAWYQETFPTRLASKRESLGELQTSCGGSRLATSVEGTLTGRGGNLIIVDDALKPSEARS